MQTAITIEQFQTMMKSEKKEGLLALFETMTTALTPEDVRRMSGKDAARPISSWVGWR
jgi:hypothetical protein